MKKVGIIVVFHNLNNYVEECLNSIKNQTFTNFQCICIDDYSTDGTFEKLQQYCLNDVRFSAIQNEKNYGSPCHSRNVGIAQLALADCEYFMLMDGDDLFHPQTVEICLDALSHNPSLNFVAFDKFTFSDPQEIHYQNYDVNNIPIAVHNNALELFLKRDSKSPQPSAWNKLYRYEHYKDFRFYEDIFYEDDYMYALQIFAKTDLFGKINLPLYCYRRHEASVTSGLRAERYLNDATTRLKHTYDYFIVGNHIPVNLDALFKQQMANDAYRMMVSKIIRKTKGKELRAKLIPIAQRNFKKLMDEKVININHLSFAQRLVIRAFLNNQIGFAKMLSKIFG